MKRASCCRSALRCLRQDALIDECIEREATAVGFFFSHFLSSTLSRCFHDIMHALDKGLRFL